MTREDEVIEQLSTINDPVTNTDLVTSGSVNELTVSANGNIHIVLELGTADPAQIQTITDACSMNLAMLSWAGEVAVAIQPKSGINPRTASIPGLQRVKNIIAISSCKGGVGKSTVAVNYAYTLAATGARVGLFDADVYGPSLPTMIYPDDLQIRQVNNMLVPFEYEGVSLMSFGYLNDGPESGPAIMRGPMVTQVVQQLLMQTAWGALDYLVIDFPPGTGDIQLTLTQAIPLSAAVIVTTPQELSFVDVVKGIQMFDKLKVPVIGVVENMSYFDCPDCGGKHYPFGKGAKNKLVKQFGIHNAFELPIDAGISGAGDSGKPLVLSDHGSKMMPVFREIVTKTTQALSAGGVDVEQPALAYDASRGMVLTMPSGEEHVISPADLRRRCSCAHCVEEMTGKPILDPASVDEKIYPVSMQPMGNYAVAIKWSDGHNSSIYPYESIVPAAFRGE